MGRHVDGPLQLSGVQHFQAVAEFPNCTQLGQAVGIKGVAFQNVSNTCFSPASPVPSPGNGGGEWSQVGGGRLWVGHEAIEIGHRKVGVQ